MRVALVYLILDGYNIIGALERYGGRSARDLEASRELLIEDTLKVAGWTERVIVVVFDAHRGPEPQRTERRAGGAVRVVYSASGESADDIIERLLGSLDGPCTVYTADHALQRTTLARSADRATPREFEALLNGLPTAAQSPEEPSGSRLRDHLPPETLKKLEEMRRKRS